MMPVIHEISKHKNEIKSVICNTGQHNELIHEVIALFDIILDYDLKLMSQNQSLAKLTSRIFLRLDTVINKEKPDWILAQGDTTTVLVASLLAFYNKIKFAHIEAGLRTGDLLNPFPEEMNRIVADMTATVCFAPTQLAMNNLLLGNISAEKIVVTGNTIVDTMAIIKTKYDHIPFPGDIQKKFILITAHRRENWGESLVNICGAIKTLALENATVDFVFPIHPNPNVEKIVQKLLAEVNNIKLIPPQNYLAMMNLLKNCFFVLTDSGGLQEEALSFAKPVLIMRDFTERKEGVLQGYAKLIGVNKNSIIENCRNLLNDNKLHSNMSAGENPYGDGAASKRIVKYLLNHE